MYGVSRRRCTVCVLGKDWPMIGEYCNPSTVVALVDNVEYPVQVSELSLFTVLWVKLSCSSRAIF